MSEQTIPVLDLADEEAGGARADAFAAAMGRALREVGFFALVHHGVEDEQLSALYQSAEELFALDTETKLAYERPGLMGQRGYTRFGREHAKDHRAPDLKEYWTTGPEPGAPAYPENLWPTQVPAFRDHVSALYQALAACAERLLRALSRDLGEDPERLVALARGGDTVLRVIHYPPVPDDADPASVRAAAHEDINLLTLLCGATAEGLEILTRAGDWLPVRALPGQVIVDSGDMMQHLTNGLLTSCTHRVVNPDQSRARRFSMPFFVHPRPEVDLTPLAGCVARSGGQRRFEPLTAGEFLRRRLEEIGLG